MQNVVYWSFITRLRLLYGWSRVASVTHAHACSYPLTARINALRACVYIYIWDLSSFRVSMLWFTDLTVTTCHIQYTFLSLCKKKFQEKTKDTKMAAVGY